MALLKKKDKNLDIKLDEKGNPIVDELEEGIGSKIVLVVVTFLIVLIWLGIIAVLIKFDVGGFGSTILRPLIKDIPYVSMILPEQEVLAENEGYQFETVEDAVVRIKELEQLLGEAYANDATDADTISKLQIQVTELQKYKEERDYFEETKEKFYEEVVFSHSAPDIEEYKTFYESIDPENAEVLYKQVVEQLQYDAKVEEYVKTYSSMKPKEAAAIFDTMTNDLQLVADILENMDAQSRADIMGKMNSEVAAKVTAIMNPPIN